MGSVLFTKIIQNTHTHTHAQNTDTQHMHQKKNTHTQIRQTNLSNRAEEHNEFIDWNGIAYNIEWNSNSISNTPEHLSNQQRANQTNTKKFSAKGWLIKGRIIGENLY